MCFSAPVSFVAGVALTAVGVVTVKKVKDKAELPFALIPFIFAVHQLIEGAVWISFGYPLFNQILTYAYLFVSHILWPIWVPFSIMALEHDVVRRKILVFFLGIGIVVGLAQFYYIVSEPVYSQVISNSLVYVVPQSFEHFMLFFYLMATCLTCAFSSHRFVKLFGLALFVSFLAAYTFFTVSCFSTWCFFAAILSGIVLLHFQLRPAPQSPIKNPKLKAFLKAK